MGINEIVTDIANVSLALSFIVALIFGISQTKAAARDRRERLTLETLRVVQSREFAELIRFIDSDDMPTTEEKMVQLSKEHRAMYVQFAQQMESLGIQVAEQLVDLAIVDKTLGSFVMLAWKKYEPVFTSRRKRDPYLGEYFQWLAFELEAYARENPRMPQYKNTTQLTLE
jgi:hypothetical protein